MYKLYNIKGWGSMGVQFLLEEMGLPYESQWVTAEEVRSPAFQAISPLNLIPALGLPDGQSLFESAAIFAYLTTAHPDTRMSPRPGTYEYGAFLSWLNYMSVNLYGVTAMAYGGGYADSNEDLAKLRARATDIFAARFQIIEDKLKKDGPYMMGKSFSALDLYLFMLVIWALPTEAAALEKYKKIAKVAAAVKSRPRLQAALEAHGVNLAGSYSYPAIGQ